MNNSATTVKNILADCLKTSAVREVILANFPSGYEDCMSYGMTEYVVPHNIFPSGYHCNPKLPGSYANRGLQWNQMALYLMGVYVDEATWAIVSQSPAGCREEARHGQELRPVQKA